MDTAYTWKLRESLKEICITCLRYLPISRVSDETSVGCQREGLKGIIGPWKQVLSESHVFFAGTHCSCPVEGGEYRAVPEQ